MPRAALSVVTVLALALGLAPAADAGCDFEHPRKAKLFLTSLVPAFVSCGNPGGNVPNTTSASGVPGCTPPQTFNQQDGTPVNGWQWNEQRSFGSLAMREVQCPFANVNCRDLRIKFRLRHILDGNGEPANGSGTLTILTRTTLEDPTVSAPGMGTDMTIIDFPAPFPFQLVNGNSTFGGGAMVLSDVNVDLLPGCTSIEMTEVVVLDSNGNPFARPGVFFKNLPN